MPETAEQADKLSHMPYSERHYRTYMGLIALKRYAKWKAGMLVLWSMSLTAIFGVIASYFCAMFIFIPVKAILDLEEPLFFSISSDSDAAFSAIAAVIFLLLGPELSLSQYQGLRSQLEELTREEGTFWS